MKSNQKKMAKPKPTPKTNEGTKQIMPPLLDEKGKVIADAEIVKELNMSDKPLQQKPLEEPKVIKSPFEDGKQIAVTHPEQYDNLTGIRTYTAPCCIEECKEWGTTVQVNKWVNGTGFEIILCTKSGSFQHLSITREEAALVQNMIKILDRAN